MKTNRAAAIAELRNLLSLRLRAWDFYMMAPVDRKAVYALKYQTACGMFDVMAQAYRDGKKNNAVQTMEVA